MTQLRGGNGVFHEAALICFFTTDFIMELLFILKKKKIEEPKNLKSNLYVRAASHAIWSISLPRNFK